jgi:hypothetical protein
VDVEITPEPADEAVRRAIEAALAASGEPVEPSVWWRAGVDDAAAADDD